MPEFFGSHPRFAKAVACLFAFVLALPFCSWFSGINYVPDIVENRTPAPSPKWPSTLDEWKTFPRGLEAYWNDAFGFRGLLIRWNTALKYLMGVPPVDLVMVGRGGWLFHTGDRETEQHRGLVRLTSDELAQWTSVLDERQKWLADRGARFALVITPDKDSIYPEQWPANVSIGSTSVSDQLIAHLAAHSHVKVIDLRQAMLAAKSNAAAPVYMRTDTHWSDSGAYVGYREILESLHDWFPNLAPRPLASFQGKAALPWCGDLGHMTGICDLVAERDLQLVPTPEVTSRDAGVAATCASSAISCLSLESGRSSDPSAVFFHDSFFVPADQRGYGGSTGAQEAYRPPAATFHIARLMGEQFSRSVFAWDAFDPALVEREHPKLVVQEMVERTLIYGIK